MVGEGVAPDDAGHAEVRQLGHLGRAGRRLGDEHVGGLDVAMDDALVVGVLEGVAQRERDGDDVAIRELAALEQGVERRATDEL